MSFHPTVTRIKISPGTRGGSVSLRPGEIDQWASTRINFPLTTGDHLWTDAGSRAELHIGSTAIRLNPETAFAFLNLDDQARVAPSHRRSLVPARARRGLCAGLSRQQLLCAQHQCEEYPTDVCFILCFAPELIEEALGRVPLTPPPRVPDGMAPRFALRRVLRALKSAVARRGLRSQRRRSATDFC
jgi:hypothetical protein